MPLYNKAPYVRKAVESVMAQTYTTWELWVIDDGSADMSAEVAESVNDARIHIVRQKNAGVSATRNRGAAESTAPYICFLDADDWWEPTFLEEMAGLIGHHPDAGIYGTGYTIVDERHHRSRPSPIGVEPGFLEGYIDYFAVYTRTKAMPLWTGAVCIPRKVFAEEGGFNPQLKMAEDFDLWVRIALKHPVAFLNKPLANYNQDVDQKTRAIGSLPPPSTQFAFCADYLAPLVKDKPAAKYMVEWVQIVCLKQYYLSREYHKLAKEVLAGIDMTEHKGKPYTEYIDRPLWIGRAKMHLYQLYDRMR